MAANQQRELPPELRSLLGCLRRRIRLYAWGEGLAAVIAVLGTVFWCFLAVDWLFEPPPSVRILILAAIACLLVAVWFRLVFHRAFVRLADTNMAVLLERHFSQFGDSLLTTVDQAPAADSGAGLRGEMVDHACQEAVQAARQVRLGGVFNPTPLRRYVVVAVALLVSITLFGVAARETFGFWIQRILLSTERWPRTTRLTVVGFPEDTQGQRVENVAHDSDFKIVARADATLPDPPPEDVEVRFRRSDGSRGRAWMTRVGNAAADRAPDQLYHYTFENVVLPLWFDVLGGDARVPDLRLQVVERPQVVEMTALCQYPDYLGRQPRWLPITGAMQIPEGTTVTIRLLASKKLRQVQVQDPDRGTQTRMTAVAAGPARQFEMVLPPLSGDKGLLVTLIDQDGIASRGPYRVVLRAVADEAPQVAVGLSGIGTAITPTARIPVAGKVTDDHGLDRIWFEYRADQRQLQTRDFTPELHGRNRQEVSQALDTRDFAEPSRLEPGQKLQMAIKAADGCDLGHGCNVGSSQVFQLEVVAPEHLRTLLDRRELLLRRRFENLVGEMTETRDLMARMDFGPAHPSPTVPTGQDSPPDRGPGSEFPAGPTDAGGTRAAAGEDVRQPARLRRRLRIMRGVQNVKRASHETLEVAAAFDEIRDEMINNRIASEARRKRLEEGISDPLKRIARQMLPSVLDRLELLQRDADLPGGQDDVLREALVRADAVLVEMQRVLDRMLELESYNEVLDLLRSIVEDQEELNEKTRQRRKQQLRGLSEE